MNTIGSASDDRILIDIREASRLLSLSERTVFALKADGLLPFVKVGKSLRFRVADLARFAEEQATAGGA